MKLEWVGGSKLVLKATEKWTEPSNRLGEWNMACIDVHGITYKVFIWDNAHGTWKQMVTCHTETAAKIAAELLI